MLPSPLHTDVLHPCCGFRLAAGFLHRCFRVLAPIPLEKLPQGLARVGCFVGRHLFRVADDDNTSSPLSALRAQIDDVVGRFYDFEVVLDNDDGVAAFDEAMQHVEELLNICKVQACCRLIQDVERAAGGSAAQLLGQLHALGLAAGKGGGRLAQSHIVHAHIPQGLQHMEDLGLVSEVFDGPADFHFKYLGYVLALILDLQGFAIEAFTFANFAFDPDIGQKIHLQAHRAVAFAGFASAPADVETEPPRLVRAQARIGQLRHERPDMIEDSDIRCGIGPGCAADG